MKRTLRLRCEELHELTTSELKELRGGTTPFYTNGHNCFGSTLCFVTLSCDC
jgi:hypothetical protein